MEFIRISEIKNLFEQKKINDEFQIKCWVKSNRDSGKIGFINAFDGSNIDGIQIVYKEKLTKGFEQAKTVRTGSAISVKGHINQNEKSPTKYEIVANEIFISKQADEDYPLQKKQHSLEFLREIAHLRPRTHTFQAIMRVRNYAHKAIHSFFQKNGFIWVSTPILTSNDCEGAGENFFISENNENHFFTPQAKLTVSGQLNAECFAQAFGRVYTFGPTFRADRSHTNRHLAEFWMVEPEIAFMNLDQLMTLIEIFIKTIVQDIAENCNDEINFFALGKKEIKERLSNLIKTKFFKIEYEHAIKLLMEAIKDGHNFEDKDIFFGKDLASEHERFICEQIYKAPVFLYNFPKQIKAFYMKLNDDNKTVAAVDLLVPGVGEIVGGSQREDNYEKLLTRIKELKIDSSSIEWYVNLRKYGYESSSGFGLGFERLIMYILGIDNIRDTIPFPRYQGKLLF